MTDVGTKMTNIKKQMLSLIRNQKKKIMLIKAIVWYLTSIRL